VLKVHPDALHMEHENPYTKRHHSSRIWKEEARSKFSHSSSPQMFSNIRNSKHTNYYDYVKDNDDNNSYVHQKDLPSSTNYYHNDPRSFQEQGQSQEQREKDSLQRWEIA
jgi:hypothetical protein